MPEKRIGGACASRYNSRIVRTTPLVALLALCFALPCRSQAPPPLDAGQEFASRIVALTGPGAATLTVTNASSANAEQFAAFRKTLQHNLQDAGVRLRQASQANSDIRVTLGENARGLVYLAEVQQGSETRPVIVEAPLVVTAVSSSAMALRRTFLVSREEPVLDAAQLNVGTETRLLLLTSQAVVLYRQGAGKWVEESSVPIAHDQRFPLDLRGRLVPTSERMLDAYLPGVICQVNVADTLHAECREADDAWPMGAQAAFFNSAGNYFNGLLRPGFGKQMAPFFSAAALPFPGYTLWIFNGVDGQLRTNDGVRQGTLNVRDWGSDVAAVRSGCGSGTQLLVTGMTDAGADDSLRGFELVERQPVLAAPAMEFNGNITALWTAQDGLSTTAVLRNAQTQNYEVFNVSIACNQ